MATQIAELFAKIGADTSGFERGLRNTHGGLTDLHSGLSMLSGAIRSVFTVGATIVGGFTAAVGTAINKAATMEQGVADISAAMSLTADETKQVKNLIKDLGLDPNLKVTATEAAQAIDMLGRNGLTVDEIMGGAARSTVLLANATGGDFALAADIATSAMQAFGLEAGDLNGIMSNISGTLVASKFDINDYGLAMAQAGGVAGAFGVEIEDFNASIAAISPLFQSGSDAGTSFKTFLQRLVPDTSSAGEAFRELGLFTGLTKDEFEKAQNELVKVEEKIAKLDPTSKNYTKTLEELTAKQTVLKDSLVQGQNAFFNADGSMKSMTEVAGLLQGALAGLTEEQKIQTLTNAFGTDAMRAAIGMANTGAVAFQELKGVIGETNAEEQAAIRMDTLSGKWEIFRGIIDANVMALGEQFLPVAKRLVEWATEWLNSKQPAINEAFARFGVLINELADGFMGVSPPLKSFANELGEALRDSFDTFTEWVTSSNFSLDEFSTWFRENKTNIVESARQIGGSMIKIAEGIGSIIDGIKRLDEWGNKLPKPPAATPTEWGMQMGGSFREWLATIFTGRAGGGPASGLTLVGERGPELVNLPVGSYVNNNSASQNMGRGGPQITIHNLNLAAAGATGPDLVNAVTFISNMYGY